MILRRLTQSLREQNWTAIAIEFVLLVVGVFLGIQVSNWNTAQIARNDARDALYRLRNDMRLSYQLTGYGMTFMAENARYANLVYERLQSCQLPEADRDAFATGLYRLGKIVPARFVSTTFDELRDSGKLGLIDDPALREALDEVARRQASHEVVFNMIASRIGSQIAYVDSTAIIRINAPVGGDARIRWSQLDIDFDTLCKDRRFKAAVAAIRNYTYDDLTDASRQQQRFENIQPLIDKALAH